MSVGYNEPLEDEEEEEEAYGCDDEDDSSLRIDLETSRGRYRRGKWIMYEGGRSGITVRKRRGTTDIRARREHGTTCRRSSLPPFEPGQPCVQSHGLRKNQLLGLGMRPGRPGKTWPRSARARPDYLTGRSGYRAWSTMLEAQPGPFLLTGGPGRVLPGWPDAHTSVSVSPPPPHRLSTLPTNHYC
ncbi:hypothetical protein EJ110_NYTH48494 [Nymphaea thermarum]|nr:hypothetical protein EJ110_NYTH48494 [Nymphaea thermarum]